MQVDRSEEIRRLEPIKKIKAKYSGNDFNYEETIEEETLSAWQRFKLWLSRVFEKLFGIDSPRTSMNVVEGFLKVLGILVIIFVIYKIINAYVNESGNWIFGKKSDAITIEATDLENEIHQLDFDKEIATAIANNNYRLAIRYYYLKTLKQLSNKSIIDWDSEKTNYDYYREIKNDKLKRQFQYISYIYNYCWYGEFEIDKNEFTVSENSFKKIINSI